MLQAALLLLWAGQTGLDRHVSYETKAKPAAAVLDELAKQSGVPMRAAGVVAGDMLVLRLKDIPLKDAMDRIAQATTAHWDQVDGVYRLTQTQAAIDKLEQTERAETLKTIQAELVAMKAEISQQPPVTSRTVDEVFQWQQDRSNRDEDEEHPASPAEEAKAVKKDLQYNRMRPEHRLAMRIIAAAFSAEQLVNLPIDDRVVFAVNPNLMQKPLRADLTGILKAYNQESGVWETTMAALKKALEPPESQAQIEPHTFGRGQAYSDNDAVKCVVVVTRSDDDVQFGFLLADSKGNLTTRNDINLSQWNSGEEDEDGTADKASSLAQPANTIELSPLGAEMLRLCHLGSEDQPGESEPAKRSWSGALVQQLTQPEENEPLASFASELLVATARERSENLVACLPDSLLLVTEPTILVAPFTDVKAFEDFEYDFDAVTEKDGWIVARPDPREAMTRLDRHLFGQLVRADQAAGRPTLDAWATFVSAIDRKNDTASSVAESLLKGLFGGIANGYWDDDALRLYGSFSPAQRRAMAAGQRTFVRSLTQPQRDLVSRLVFINSRARSYTLRLESAPASEEGAGDETTLASCELTEAYPRGLPGDTEVVLDDETVDRFWVSVNSGPRETGQEPFEYETNLGMDELADMLLRVRKPELFPDDEKPLLGAVRRFKFRLVMVSIRSGTEVFTDQTLPESIPVSGSFDIDHLPADVRKQLEPLIAKAEKERREELKHRDDPPPPPPG